MTEPFDVPTWKTRVADWWRETAPNLADTAQRLGLNTAYGTLTASAWLPLLAAYADNPGPAVAALAGVLSGVGTNLLSNLVQGVYDRATAPQQAECEVAERPDLRPEYQHLLAELDVIAAAQDALGDGWAAFEAELRQELSHLGGGLRIDSGGGAVILGNVTVRHGDFVARDKIVHIHPPPPAPDVTPLRQAYLRQVVSRTEHLTLRGVDVGAADPRRVQRPRLSQVYIDLDTTASVPLEEQEEEEEEAE